MAFWSWLIGTPTVVEAVTKTATGVVDKGMNMLDQAFYTDQEKKDAALKFTELFLKLQTLLANDSGISAIARRAAATLILGTFCFLVLMAAGVYIISPSWSEYIVTLIDKTNMGYLALLVGFFFFGFYAFGKYTSIGTTSTDAFKEEKK